MDPVGIGSSWFSEELYEDWKRDPRSVPSEWGRVFQAIDAGAHLAPAPSGAIEAGASAAPAGVARSTSPTYTAPTLGVAGGDRQSRVDSLIWAYRDVGAIYAHLNPLGSYETPEMRYMRITVEGAFESLTLETFGLSEADLDTEFSTGGFIQPVRQPLREIIAHLKRLYLGTLGVEFLHIKNRVMRRWIMQKVEQEIPARPWSEAQKIRFQKDLIKAEEFEHFVHQNFIGQKRFSLEGGEGLIPALHYLIYSASDHGIKEIVLGMAHRGRLNVFTNALRKLPIETFARFIDAEQPHVYGGTGDVKYHLGHSFDYHDPDTGKTVHISLVANPSHLEAVDPVVQGKARGIQRRHGDVNRKKVMPILIHGDAAFSGQGVVQETLNLSQLKGYRTGGTVHIIVNNQIGFTTASRDARSTFFATDYAKGFQLPIFHANGDDPESVVRAVDLALRWRQKFGYDVIVDIICYRRLGHNEADEPSYTHPIMYKMIKDHPSAPVVYGKRLAEGGVWDEAGQQAFRTRYRTVLNEQLELAKSPEKRPAMDDAFESGEWTAFRRGYSFEPVITAVPEDRLHTVGTALTTVPSTFNLHSKLARIVGQRRNALESGSGVDWGFAEALAMGTLLHEGYAIRLSGEDSGRGTFSHRHAEWWDVSTDTPYYYTPLKHISSDQGSFSVYDSPLSEFGVLGFDYGYSLAQPNILVIWEAQFGDFVNGAQVIIDQFISSSESKWFRSSGLVMLLPHGYEGQGPEHSSAHLERFLQLCADNNMQVVNPTMPAQIFHLLRRQLLSPFRKPLIVMSPKSLLRHKDAQSTIADLTERNFHFVIDDPTPPANVETLIFCSGKVFFDLDERRRLAGKADTVAIVRIEQLYPWPLDAITAAFDRYRSASRIVWAQEESRNRGAWRFVQNRLAKIAGVPNIEYVGRAPSPSPATGSYREHAAELDQLLTAAIGPVAEEQT